MSHSAAPVPTPTAQTSVAAEMEAIFGSAASAPRQSRAVIVVPVKSAARGTSKVMALVGLLLAAVVLALVWWQHNATPPSPPAKRLPFSVSLSRGADSQLPRTPLASPNFAPAQTSALPTTATATSSKASPRANIIRAKPRARVQIARVRSKPRRLSRTSGSVPPAHCADVLGDQRYACTLDALAAADGRLRRAFDSAAMTGVPRRDLTDARDRWSSLRQKAPRRPLWVADQYDAIAAELEAASSRAK